MDVRAEPDVWRREWGRKGNNLKGFQDYYLNAKARIWP